MTLDCGTSFWYDVNVINVCDCLCYSQICAGILALIHDDGKWKDLKAATAFQICVFISNR